MSSLVLELQAAAIDHERKVDELLRMALVVATKLKQDELRAWCEKELKGYGREQVPAYRVVRGELKARNPFHGWIPVMVTDAELMRRLTERPVGSSISELEHLLDKREQGGHLHMPLPHEELLAIFGDSQEFRLGMVPTLLVGSSEVHGIVAAVRDALLAWSLDLEQKGILGENMTFSREEVRKAEHITYNINSFTGVLGDITGSQVQVGNYNAIHGDLKRLGVPQTARNELEQILDELSTVSPKDKKSVAKRGMEWLGKHGQTIGALSDTIRGWVEPFLG